MKKKTRARVIPPTLPPGTILVLPNEFLWICVLFDTGQHTLPIKTSNLNLGGNLRNFNQEKKTIEILYEDGVWYNTTIIVNSGKLLGIALMNKNLMPLNFNFQITKK